MFECHVTVDVKDAPLAAQIAVLEGWSTSEIARDPVLGNKNYFYLTKHSKFVNKLFFEMNQLTLLFAKANIEVLREKIEVIIHDSKQG